MEKFEDLITWQKARELTKKIYGLTSDGQFAKDFGLRDQIRRAALLVMSNISEVFERGSAKEFHQFLVIARASCAEVRSQLYVAFDAGYIDETIFQKLNQQAIEVSRIVGGLRSSVDKKRT
ncbi:four helix bundle protein [Prosthecochloris sp. SCSIO W1101]|uniref:four helix bundle protein n=1 Tax=Prosthecochloris sp. SCSIO W1101 TaxID=2992242 RepID=UPI0039FC8F06